MTGVLLVLAVALLLVLVARELWRQRVRIDWPTRPCIVAAQAHVRRDVISDPHVLRVITAQLCSKVQQRAEREAQWDEDPTTWPLVVTTSNAFDTWGWSRGLVLLRVECRIPPETETT